MVTFAAGEIGVIVAVTPRGPPALRVLVRASVGAARVAAAWAFLLALPAFSATARPVFLSALPVRDDLMLTALLTSRVARWPNALVPRVMRPVAALPKLAAPEKK